MSKVLVIADTHCPAMHPKYPAFLSKMQKRHKTTHTVHIGDLVDWCSISYHPKAPSLKNSYKEFKNAQKQVKKVYERFPECTWLIGNHDALTERHAIDVGLPMEVFKDYATMWSVPNWEVVPRFGNIIIDEVLYQHGDRGRGGKFAAGLNMESEFRSVVQGHLHAQAGVVYRANQRTCVFGMQVGCGVDHEKEAMDYGKKYAQKPIIGCGIVIDGHTAIFEPMHL
jgi:predicted phosphodiesterase